jgi:hypothetical protein
MKLIDRGGQGLTPVGYGYHSIEGLVQAVHRMEEAVKGLSEEESLPKRQQMIKTIDKEDMIATPGNSAFNELVIEAGRLSILNGGREVMIEYGNQPGVHFKE